MTNGWTDILNQAGDENIGAALVRLARLAEAVHRAESAELLRRQSLGGGVAAEPQPIHMMTAYSSPVEVMP